MSGEQMCFQVSSEIVAGSLKSPGSEFQTVDPPTDNPLLLCGPPSLQAALSVVSVRLSACPVPPIFSK